MIPKSIIVIEFVNVNLSAYSLNVSILNEETTLINSFITTTNITNAITYFNIFFNLTLFIIIISSFYISNNKAILPYFDTIYPYILLYLI